MKSMITDRIGRHEVLLQLIKNITLSEDLRKDKKLVKGVNVLINGALKRTNNNYKQIRMKWSRSIFLRIFFILIKISFF